MCSVSGPMCSLWQGMCPVFGDARSLRLSYSDGAAGEVDLSHLAGSGVFAAWNDRTRFAAVHITDCDAIAWDTDVELCPDALYMQLTGKSLTDVMPQTFRLGFMAGQIDVPDDLNRMGGPEIEKMFGATA